VDAGFECVEVDVSRTKDGHLVALHSRELRRLTNGAKTSVAEITLREAMALEMPSGSYGVATFAEAMATVVNRGLRQITVDFKEDGRPGHAVSFAQTALAEIAMVDPDNGCPECVYWGKDDSVMLDVLREFPEARVGYTVANFSAAMRDGGLDNHADARARPIIARAYCAAVQSEMASHKLRRECVRAGVAKVRRVANEGVDAIVTDEPGEATRQIRALRDGCPRPESTKSGRAAERHNRS
jgi:glycerophosphoryl diester phosphodiesterase